MTTPTVSDEKELSFLVTVIGLFVKCNTVPTQIRAVLTGL